MKREARANESQLCVRLYIRIAFNVFFSLLNVTWFMGPSENWTSKREKRNQSILLLPNGNGSVNDRQRTNERTNERLFLIIFRFDVYLCVWSQISMSNQFNVHIYTHSFHFISFYCYQFIAIFFSFRKRHNPYPIYNLLTLARSLDRCSVVGFCKWNLWKNERKSIEIFIYMKYDSNYGVYSVGDFSRSFTPSKVASPRKIGPVWCFSSSFSRFFLNMRVSISCWLIWIMCVLLFDFVCSIDCIHIAILMVFKWKILEIKYRIFCFLLFLSNERKKNAKMFSVKILNKLR